MYVIKLSEKFVVIEETIRRDLEKLELQGIVKSIDYKISDEHPSEECGKLL